MKILILRLSSIGDIVLTQPVVAELVRQYPQAEIHYLTKKAFHPIVEAFGYPITIHFWENLKNVTTLIKFGRILKFDLVIDLHNKLNTFIIKKAVAGKITSTYKKQHTLRRKIVKQKTDKSIDSTVSLYYSALNSLGIYTDFSYPKLQQDKNSDLSKYLPSEKIEKWIGVFPGAQHKTKQYPVEQLLEVMKLISENHDIQFFTLGSASEQHLADYLIQNSNLKINDLCGKLSIKELIDVTDHFDFVISNDSGPMHIAAALGKPQIATFGATHPKLGFAPLNKKAAILTADLPCQPCSLHGGESCPLKHFNCMKSITPELVATKINQHI